MTCECERDNESLRERLRSLRIQVRDSAAQVLQLQKVVDSLEERCSVLHDEREASRERVKELKGLVEMRATPIKSAREEELLDQVRQLKERLHRGKRTKFGARVRYLEKRMEALSESVQVLKGELLND